MGYKMLDHPMQGLFSGWGYHLFDDFNEFVTGDLWTTAVAGTGTVLHDGSVGRSHMELFCTAANDAAVLPTTHELFKFIANKAMTCRGRIIFTDVDTDDGMLFFGWADALAATTLADTSGAVTATDACCIYKLPDTTVYAFHTEINGAAVASVSDLTAGGAAHQELRIEVIPRSAAVLEARPYVDGVQLKTAAGLPIKHDITLGTATEMDFGVMTKSNDAADFSLFVDYLYAAQARS